MFKIGVVANSFRRGFRENIKAAAECGVDGVQIYATGGEFSPENLDTKEKRREALDYIRSHGLAVSALCGDFGKGFWRTELNPDLIERSKRILDMALDFECTVVTTHIGVVPKDRSNPRYGIMLDACTELAEYGQRIGASFAVETGPEPSETLRDFILDTGASGLRVNLDPANLAMVIGEDSVHAAKVLAPLTVHTHAKDGIMLEKGDPEVIYSITHLPEGLTRPQYFKEVPLGEGSVDFPRYLPALRDAGYDGFLTIEREVGEDPAADIKKAVTFLRGIIAKTA